MGKSSFAARLQNSSFQMPILSPCQHCTHPSYTLSVELGITRLSSIPITLPNPSQEGHAPSGELKANMLSDGSSKVIPSVSKREENSYVMLEGRNTSLHSPWPSYIAVSTESVSREICSLVSSTARRSMSKRYSSGLLSFSCSAFSVRSSMRTKSPLCHNRA